LIEFGDSSIEVSFGGFRFSGLGDRTKGERGECKG